MRSAEYLYVLLLPSLAGNLVMAKNKLVNCKLEAIKLSAELDCIYKSVAEPWNLAGKTVRATAPEGNLTQGEIVFQTILLPNGTKSLKFKEGFGVDVLNALHLALGFNLKVVTAKSWATQYPNKSWFGMAQQIIDGEADLSIAKTSILPNRAQDLGYLVPTHGLGLYAFFVQPSSKSGRNIFIEPFTPSLWLTLLGVYIILIVTIRVISKLAEVTIGLEPEDRILTDEVTIWSCHTICQHGFHSPPKLICLRIAIVSGVILGLLVYVSYSAQLVSMFSFVTFPIKNIEDLLKSKINILVDGNNQRAKNLIEGQGTDKDPIAVKLATHMKPQKKLFASAGEGGGSVLKANSSIITFKDSFYTTTKNTFGTLDDEFCQKVATVSVSGTTFKSGLFVKKGSFLKEPFNVKMVVMINSGLMGRFVTNYEETYTPRCDSDKATETPIITFTEVIFVYYGLGLGFALSLTLCLTEFILCRCPTLNYLIICLGSTLFHKVS